MDDIDLYGDADAAYLDENVHHSADETNYLYEDLHIETPQVQVKQEDVEQVQLNGDMEGKLKAADVDDQPQKLRELEQLNSQHPPVDDNVSAASLAVHSAADVVLSEAVIPPQVTIPLANAMSGFGSPAIIVSGLTWWTTDQDITDICNDVGLSDQFIKHELTFNEHHINGKSKGIAYLLFKSPDAAHKARQFFESIELHGVQLKTSIGPTSNPFRVLPKSTFLQQPDHNIAQIPQPPRQYNPQIQPQIMPMEGMIPTMRPQFPPQPFDNPPHQEFMNQGMGFQQQYRGGYQQAGIFRGRGGGYRPRAPYSAPPPPMQNYRPPFRPPEEPVYDPYRGPQPPQQQSGFRPMSTGQNITPRPIYPDQRTGEPYPPRPGPENPNDFAPRHEPRFDQHISPHTSKMSFADSGQKDFQVNQGPHWRDPSLDRDRRPESMPPVERRSESIPPGPPVEQQWRENRMQEPRSEHSYDRRPEASYDTVWRESGNRRPEQLPEQRWQDSRIGDRSTEPYDRRPGPPIDQQWRDDRRPNPPPAEPWRDPKIPADRGPEPINHTFDRERYPDLQYDRRPDQPYDRRMEPPREPPVQRDPYYRHSETHSTSAPSEPPREKRKREEDFPLPGEIYTAARGWHFPDKPEPKRMSYDYHPRALPEYHPPHPHPSQVAYSNNSAPRDQERERVYEERDRYRDERDKREYERERRDSDCEKRGEPKIMVKERSLSPEDRRKERRKERRHGESEARNETAENSTQEPKKSEEQPNSGQVSVTENPSDLSVESEDEEGTPRVKSIAGAAKEAERKRRERKDRKKKRRHRSRDPDGERKERKERKERSRSRSKERERRKR